MCHRHAIVHPDMLKGTMRLRAPFFVQIRCWRQAILPSMASFGFNIILQYIIIYIYNILYMMYNVVLYRDGWCVAGSYFSSIHDKRIYNVLFHQFHACLGLACFVDNPGIRIRLSRPLEDTLEVATDTFETEASGQMKNTTDKGDKGLLAFSPEKSVMNRTEGFRFTVFTVPGLNRNKLFSLRKQAVERKQALQDQFSESKHWENR